MKTPFNQLMVKKKQFTSALHDHCSNIIQNLDVAAHLHVMSQAQILNSAR